MAAPYLWLLLADACMVGVILCVQLIIYPGFRHTSRNALVAWHARYAQRIAALVIPLMLLQLLGGSAWFRAQPGWASGVYLGLILLLWGLTFRVFVPLHRRIGQGFADERTFRRLVAKNGYRTALWLLAFAWHAAAFAGWIPQADFW